MTRSPQQDWRSRLSKHWLPVSIGIALTSGGVVYGLMDHFHSAELAALKAANELKTSSQEEKISRLKEKISGLEGQLASVNRGLAGGDYFNVARLVVPRTNSSHIPASDKFFADDGFYAAMPPNWTYQKMQDAQLWNAVYGKPGDKPPNSLTSLASIHVWRRGDFVSLEGNGMINHIAPMITVQRLPNKVLMAQLGIGDEDIAAWRSDNRKNGFDEDELKKSLAEMRLRTVFQGDVVGAVLTQNFSLVFDQLRAIKGVDANLVTINKVQNVLYCQVLITLKDARINNTKFGRYYITAENIVISTRENLYIINTAVPRPDPAPRGPIAAEITQWLNEFAIPE